MLYVEFQQINNTKIDYFLLADLNIYEYKNQGAYNIFHGGVSEWFKVLRWKRSVWKRTVGSNPISSAINF